ncbi:MAG: hypothetical protein JSW65_01775 [Candidatus Bipolaricaulota bacterium]|nr:MAG: hypothetical protein JSW65_01775 [Candidatus Bipolaricaulota bacterium]
MKRIATVLSVAAVVAGLLALVSCGPGGMILPQAKRVTFALVIDTRAYNGITVIARLVDSPGGAVIEELAAGLESYPNTAFHAWAKLTTLETIETGRRYFVEFALDLDGDSVRSSGDLEGTQVFDVMPNAIWSETKYFSADLFPIP